MPLETLRLRPGIDVERTPTLNEGGWSSSNLIRWKERLPQKLGGWEQYITTALTGTGRGFHAWADLSGNPYIAVGTEQRLMVVAAGELEDITPLRATANITVDFSTTNASATVTIGDTAHEAVAGDWINIVTPVSVGGIVLYGFYRVVTVVDADNYTVTAADAATATVASGGAVPVFDTTLGSPNVQVTLADHGYSAAETFVVDVSTAVGGLTLSGSYTVTAPVTTDTFIIVASGNATSTATGSENGGNVRIQYLIPSGLSSVGQALTTEAGVDITTESGLTIIVSTVGYGLRQWFLDNWGEFLIGNYSNGPLYYWDPPTVTPATEITAGPLYMTASFVAMPARVVVALGAETGGTQDPNLVRWCDVDDYDDWTASATNQAGSYRIPTGSRIVGGIQAQQAAFIWTDYDFWTMAYVGPPFIFSFRRIASGCELMAARGAVAVYSDIYWVADENFYVFDGNNVSVLPCPVWDEFFYNFNATQRDKVWAWVNHSFTEVWWFYPSLNAAECDSYVKYNIVERVWDFGTMDRTCGQDSHIIGGPMAVDASGLIQQHETGYTANGAAMGEYVQTAWMAISDGDYFTFIERVIPDFVLLGPNKSVEFYVLVADYPTDTPAEYGPYEYTDSGPDYFVVRARGRVAALKIMGTDTGSFWRLGGVRYIGSPAGRRA